MSGTFTMTRSAEEHQRVWVVEEVLDERVAQHAKWGEQNHPDGTSADMTWMATAARQITDEAARTGRLHWSHILAEEFWEAMAEEDPVKLRAELIQVAAVAVAWAEAIDRRTES